MAWGSRVSTVDWLQAFIPADAVAGTPVTPGGDIDIANSNTQIPCAGPSQSTTALHSPFTPDSQIQDWRYNRQQEYNWTELFFNYGNSVVSTTIGIHAFGLSDSGYIAGTNAGTQLGIAQAYLTLRPDLGIRGLRMQWRVGSFWDRYGMAGRYDAGKYDTFMFGRTHQMGETLSAEYRTNGLEFRVAHGFGTRAEQIAFTPLQAGNFTLPQGNENNYPGFTLLHHVHAGFSVTHLFDFNAHYLTSFAHDYTPLPWFGFGVRADDVRPTNKDKLQSFQVVSPKLIFKTSYVSHEEITVWYSHYWYGTNVMPQPPNGIQNPNTAASGNGTVAGPSGPFPADENIVGIKGTVWW